MYNCIKQFKMNYILELFETIIRDITLSTLLAMNCLIQYTISSFLKCYYGTKFRIDLYTDVRTDLLSLYKGRKEKG